MNSTKPLIKLGARLINNNYHLFIDKDMNGPNKAIFNTIPSNLIALFYCFILNQIVEKISIYFYCFNNGVFFSRTHCSRKIKTRIIIPSYTYDSKSE